MVFGFTKFCKHIHYNNAYVVGGNIIVITHKYSYKTKVINNHIKIMRILPVVMIMLTFVIRHLRNINVNMYNYNICITL